MKTTRKPETTTGRQITEIRSAGRFTPQEHIISVLPAAVAGILLLGTLVAAGLNTDPNTSNTNQGALITFGILGSLYLVFFHLLYIPIQSQKRRYVWINAVVCGFSLGLVHAILPPDLDVLVGLLLITVTISSAIISVRGPAYFLLGSAYLLTYFIRASTTDSLIGWSTHLGIVLIALIAVETVLQLKNLSRRHINRLEIINEFSRQIASSLDTNQVLSLLNAAIQNALEVDTYYVGLLEGETIHLSPFYDEGEYFQEVRVNLEGSLSGWVIKNQRELFLPDLRHDVQLPGVGLVTIGKDKPSLAWMGVPIQTPNVTGMLATASYRPNAFDRGDLELLANLAQHAALALDNAIRHAQVEEQTHLDSLTGVYNHGHFLKLLAQFAEDAHRENHPLSLIMLDVDHFKQYNDRYGHLAGDEVLTTLTNTIKRHLKRTDIVGRWGGEEFVLALPATSGEQAHQVANRIRETMNKLTVAINQEKTFPVPTVSQGIAQFPVEADEVFKLIDLADHRLYVAKARGRNQIEPGVGHWETIASS